MPMEKCDNCGRDVGSLEQPFVWNDHPVCAACHRLLSSETKVTAAQGNRTTLLLAGVIAAGVFVIVAIIVSLMLHGHRSRNRTSDDMTSSAAEENAPQVDLMAMIDPPKNTVAGVWMMKDGALQSSGEQWSRLEIPYDPPAEYDFEVEFARKSGADSIVQLASQQGRPFGFSMGFWDDSALAIDAKGENIPPAARHTGWIGRKVRHQAILKVRRDRVEAWLDGRLTLEWKTGSAEHGIQDGWKLNDPKRLGIGGFSPAEFYKLTLVPR